MKSTIYELYEVLRRQRRNLDEEYDNMARAEEEQLAAFLAGKEAKHLLCRFKTEMITEMERKSWREQVDVLYLGIQIGMEIQQAIAQRED